MAQRGRKSVASLMVVPVASAPVVAAGSRPPRHLAKEERDLWHEMVRELNITAATGFAMLVVALEAHATMRECRKAIAKQGLLVAAGTDLQLTKANPLSATERGARQGWINALRQLGYGKTSRKKQQYVDAFGNLQDEVPSAKIWERE